MGAGAIGGYLGGKLALAGEEVTLIARGKHLEAIQRNGLVIQEADGSTATVKPARAISDPSAAGVHDVVVLSVKAHSLPAVVPELKALMGPDTAVVTAQNGLPWWYFQNCGGEYEGRRLHSVDPEGVLSGFFDAKTIIGSILYFAAEVVEPGIVKRINGDRVILGELDGSDSERVRALCRTFAKTGLDVAVTRDIRKEIWLKLWGNVAFNPISALTGASVRQLAGYPPMRELIRDVMAECRKVAEQLGVRMDVTEEERIQRAEQMGNHKPSMLQDIEAGRPTEADTMVGAVIELAKLTGVATPRLEAVYVCLKMLDQKSRGVRL